MKSKSHKINLKGEKLDPNSHAETTYLSQEINLQVDEERLIQVLIEQQ